MSDRVLVSVIMPVYNSEDYLENAVETVLRQDFDGFELIVVDDGSPDESGKICDRIAQKDSRVVVIHKPNGGICSARNAGLDRARGKYIAFCDNDDEYLPGLISENYALAERENADLVRFCRSKTETYNGKVSMGKSKERGPGFGPVCIKRNSWTNMESGLTKACVSDTKMSCLICHVTKQAAQLC